MKKKYSAFALFTDGTGKMEFSKNLARLQKLILVPEVKKLEIFDAKTEEKLITLTKKIHDKSNGGKKTPKGPGTNLEMLYEAWG